MRVWGVRDDPKRGNTSPTAAKLCGLHSPYVEDEGEAKNLLL